MKHLIVSLIFSTIIFSQVKDKAIFIESKNDYWNLQEEKINKFNNVETRKKLSFKVDFSGKKLPKSKEEMTYFWHNEPKNQGKTGSCWSFSATSFFESEIYRIHKRKIKLSPMWNVYWEYVEKARRFVNERGNSFLGEGSEANALKRIWNNYGCVPYDAFTGLLPGQEVYDHSKLFDEFRNYLFHIKSSNAWNEELVVQTVKSILNKYMGAPPEQFIFENKNYTAKEFFSKVININFDNYIDIISLKQNPYFEFCEYEVDDNWWHDTSYYNVPLNNFLDIIKTSIKNGYTVCIGGDVSEPGYDFNAKCAIIPSFDIPSDFIDEDSRQLRFTNGTTQDDHGLHLVGYSLIDGKMWFLIKDSGAGAYNFGDKGYYFYHEDYIKLKIIDFLVHKDWAMKYIKID